MARYHLKDNGEPGLCRAELGKCPKGGDHFDSKEEAWRTYEENLNSKNFLKGLSLLKDKKPKSISEVEEELKQLEMVCSPPVELNGPMFKMMFTLENDAGRIYDICYPTFSGKFKVDDWTTDQEFLLSDLSEFAKLSGESEYVETDPLEKVSEAFGRKPNIYNANKDLNYGATLDISPGVQIWESEYGGYYVVKNLGEENVDDGIFNTVDEIKDFLKI